MENSDKIIISIVVSIIGFISLIVIICLIIWFVLRRQSKSENQNQNQKRNPSIPERQRYERSHNVSVAKYESNKRRKRKRRFNTNDSAISFSFNPPHLINQNVKNLDKLLPVDSSFTTNRWHYEDMSSARKPNNLDGLFSNITSEPIHTSSSLSTPISKPITDIPHYQQLNALQFRFLNQLNQGIIIRQEQRPINQIRYSQSCRQANDPLPFDYYRSTTPSFILTNENSPDPNYARTPKYSNTTLMRKAQLAKLRDDTAILY